MFTCNILFFLSGKYIMLAANNTFSVGMKHACMHSVELCKVANNTLFTSRWDATVCYFCWLCCSLC